MVREKVETTRINVRLTVEAADLLDKLAPSENRRGRYLSELITRAAQEAGLVEAPAPPTLADRIAALERELGGLKSEVAQQGRGGVIRL